MSTQRQRAGATRVLLAAARHTAALPPADGSASAPLARVPEDVDWGLVLREGLRNGVLALLHRLAQAQPGLVPEVVAGDLERTYAEGRRRNLRLAAELVAVTQRLSHHGIATAPWKGPLLAERAYGDLAMRSFYDLDVLVRRTDISAARDVLLAAGYRPEKPLSPLLQARYIAQQGELELIREVDGLRVELHWAAVPNYYAPPRDDRHLAEVWERLVAARVGRASVTALAMEDELEALCVHGSKHRWDRLMWIVDIAMVARSHPQLDWQALLDRAERHGTLRMVHLGLRLAMQVCRADLPPSVVAQVLADRGAAGLARQVQGALSQPDDGALGAFLFHARMRDRTPQRARYALSVLFTPSGADWDAFALPDRLFGLYALTRPLRLARQYAGGVLRREGRWH